MSPIRQGGKALWLVLLVAGTGFSAPAQNSNDAATSGTSVMPGNTNPPAQAALATPGPTVSTQAPPAQTAAVPTAVAPQARRSEGSSSRLDDSAFRIIGERNIFNASRSGGQVRLSSRRPSRIESFTLVGTMAYERGAFAFFNGTSSEFNKVLKADGVIAGHKVVDILTDAVKLEADGKTLELAVGSAMRREDEGTWHPGEAAASNSVASPDRERSDRGNGSESSSATVTTSSPGNVNQSEILKRLMERREKESQ